MFIECLTCRKKTKIKRRYYGESSRSAYQRGVEHQKEISDGVLAHPMVGHFWEEHRGIQQGVLMRILSVHITPLDRQIQESNNIMEAMRAPAECLNHKTEWGGSKIPTMTVNTPKGVSRTQDRDQEVDPEQQEAIRRLQEAARRGQKRIQ